MTTPQTPPPADPGTFDREVMERLRRACDDVCLHHPEVKAIAAVVTWNGELNDAALHHALWRGADGGPVVDAAGIVTGLFQTLKLLEMQFARAGALAVEMRDRVLALA